MITLGDLITLCNNAVATGASLNTPLRVTYTGPSSHWANHVYRIEDYRAEPNCEDDNEIILDISTPVRQ